MPENMIARLFDRKPRDTPSAESAAASKDASAGVRPPRRASAPADVLRRAAGGLRLGPIDEHFANDLLIQHDAPLDAGLDEREFNGLCRRADELKSSDALNVESALLLMGCFDDMARGLCAALPAQVFEEREVFLPAMRREHVAAVARMRHRLDDLEKERSRLLSEL